MLKIGFCGVNSRYKNFPWSDTVFALDTGRWWAYSFQWTGQIDNKIDIHDNWELTID